MAIRCMARKIDSCGKQEDKKNTDAEHADGRAQKLAAVVIVGVVGVVVVVIEIGLMALAVFGVFADVNSGGSPLQSHLWEAGMRRQSEGGACHVGCPPHRQQPQVRRLLFRGDTQRGAMQCGCHSVVNPQ